MIAGLQTAQRAIGKPKGRGSHVFHVDSLAAERIDYRGNSHDIRVHHITQQIDVVTPQPRQNATPGNRPVKQPVLGIAEFHLRRDHPRFTGHDPADSPALDEPSRFSRGRVIAILIHHAQLHARFCRARHDLRHRRNRRADRLFADDVDPALEQAQAQVWIVIIADAGHAKQHGFRVQKRVEIGIRARDFVRGNKPIHSRGIRIVQNDLRHL